MNIFLNLLKFFPLVLSSVAAVEQVVGTSVPGATKKSIVLDSIVAVTKQGEKVPDSTINLLSSLIDSVVTSLNKSGVFDHGNPPVTVTISAPAILPKK